MKLMGNTYLILGSVLVIALVGNLLINRYASRKPQIVEEKVLNIEEISGILGVEIKSDFGDIEIRPTKEQEIRMVLKGNVSEHKKYTFLTNINESTLEIELKQRQARLLSMNIFSEMLTLVVYLPEKQFEEINITNDVGSIIVNEVTTKKMKVRSSVGEIKLNQITAEQTLTTNDIGATQIKDLMGDIQVKSRIGEIKFMAKTINQNIEMQSDIGAIRIEVEEVPESAIINIGTQMGTTRLFGEKTNSFQVGSGENKVNLSSQIGEIVVRRR